MFRKQLIRFRLDSNSETSTTWSDIPSRGEGPTPRLTRVEDVMRIFSSPTVGSRRFTSVVVDKQDRDLLSYEGCTEDTVTVNTRASTRMINFIHAMCTIYGAKASLSPQSFIMWRRKLMHWVRLKTLETRVAKQAQIEYTVDPSHFNRERQMKAQQVRQRLRNELKAHTFQINNHLERMKLEKRLACLRKKQLQRWITELGSREYRRIQNLLNRGTLSADEMVQLRDEYLKGPPKAISHKSDPIEMKRATWPHIPLVKIAPPNVYSLKPLKQTISATLKGLAEDTPEVKRTLYAIERNKPNFSSDEMYAILEEAFGPPSFASNHTQDSKKLTTSEVPAATLSVPLFTKESVSQMSVNPEDTPEESNPSTFAKLQRIEWPNRIPHSDDDTSVYEIRTIEDLYSEAARLFKAYLHNDPTDA